MSPFSVKLVTKLNSTFCHMCSQRRLSNKTANIDGYLNYRYLIN